MLIPATGDKAKMWSACAGIVLDERPAEDEPSPGARTGTKCYLNAVAD